MLCYAYILEQQKVREREESKSLQEGSKVMKSLITRWGLISKRMEVEGFLGSILLLN